MLPTAEDVQALLVSSFRTEENLELLFHVCWATLQSASDGLAGQAILPYNEPAFLLYDDRLWKARHLLLSGYYEARFGHYYTALRLYEDAVSLSYDAQQLDVRILALCGVAFMHHCLKQNDAATKILHLALDLARSNDYRLESAICYNVLGVVYHARRVYQEAGAWYQRSKDVCIELKALPYLIVLSQQLGALHIDMGDPGSAYHHFLYGRELLEKTPNTFGSILSALNIGRLLHSSGESDIAAESLNRALLLASDHSRSREILLTMTELALLRREAGDVVNALVLLAEALSIAKEFSSPFESLIIGEIGQCYLDLRHPASALEHFRWAARRSDVHGYVPLQVSAHHRLHRHYQLIEDMPRTRLELQMLEELLAEATRSPLLRMMGMKPSGGRLLDRGDEDEMIAMFTDAPGDSGLYSWRNSHRSRPDNTDSVVDHVLDEFLNRLAGLYPGLSRMELKIVLLLRQNLSTKEIADHLCLSERSIRNHRYRLRKKFNLLGKESLTTFLVSF